MGSGPHSIVSVEVPVEVSVPGARSGARNGVRNETVRRIGRKSPRICIPVVVTYACLYVTKE